MADPDLLAFVRRCLDEDGRVAKQATAQGVRDLIKDNMDRFRVVRHVAQWEPDRVLAEVEAKRAILDWAVTWLERDCAPWNADLIRMLALPYAGREGWREEWRDG